MRRDFYLVKLYKATSKGGRGGGHDYDSPKAEQQAKHMEGGVVATAILLHTLYGIIAAHTTHDAVDGFV